MIQKYKQLLVGSVFVLAAFAGSKEVQAQGCPTSYGYADIVGCSMGVLEVAAAIDEKIVPTCFTYDVDYTFDLIDLLYLREIEDCNDEYIVAEGFHGE